MDKTMLLPKEICDFAVNAGIKKTQYSVIQTSILGMMAGAFIAAGGFASSVVSHSIENFGIAKLAAGAVFPAGLILVILCGGELFTGNALLSSALMDGKIRVSQVLKNWGIAYIFNFIGAFIVSYLIYLSGSLSLNSGGVGAYAIKVASYKGGLGFWTAFTSGIMCNFLVCLAVYSSYAAKDVVGKILAIWFPIMLFVVSGFEHSVANMYYFSIGILSKINPSYAAASHLSAKKLAEVNWLSAASNLLPVTLGNIVGGAVFVGLAYWIVFRFHENGSKKES